MTVIRGFMRAFSIRYNGGVKSSDFAALYGTLWMMINVTDECGEKYGEMARPKTSRLSGQAGMANCSTMRWQESINDKDHAEYTD